MKAPPSLIPPPSSPLLPLLLLLRLFLFPILNPAVKIHHWSWSHLQALECFLEHGGEKSTSAQSQTICLPPPSLSASRRHPHFSLLAFHLHADVLVRSTRPWIFSNFISKASRRKKTRCRVWVFFFFHSECRHVFFPCGAEGVDGLDGWMVGLQIIMNAAFSHSSPRFP